MRYFVLFFVIFSTSSLVYIFTPLPTPEPQPKRTVVNISEVCATYREVSSETCTLVETLAQVQGKEFAFPISSNELTALRDGKEVPFVNSRMIRFSIYLLAKHAKEIGEKEIGEAIALKTPYLLDHYFGTTSQRDERRVAVRRLYDLSNSEDTQNMKRLCKHVLVHIPRT